MLHRAWVKVNPVPWLSSHHILALQKIQGLPRLEMCGESSWHEQRKENVQGLFLPIQTQLHLWGLMPAKYFDSFICYFISPSQPLQEARECFTGYEWKKKKKRPQWGEASHSWSGMLLHSKAKNFDPHIQKFFFHFMYWETHQAICFNIYISLRLEFWVACFSTYHTPDQVGGERNRKGHVVWTNWLWESQMKI